MNYKIIKYLIKRIFSNNNLLWLFLCFLTAALSYCSPGSIGFLNTDDDDSNELLATFPLLGYGAEYGYPDAAYAPVVTLTSPTNDTTPAISWVSAGKGNGNYRYKFTSDPDDDDMNINPTATTSTSYTPDTPLDDGMYYFLIQEQLSIWEWSAVSINTVTIDTLPPGPATGLTATPYDVEVWLEWQIPEINEDGTDCNDYAGTILRKKKNSEGCPASSTDGTLVVDNQRIPAYVSEYYNPDEAPPPNYEFPEYCYTAFAYDLAGNIAQPSATVVESPYAVYGGITAKYSFDGNATDQNLEGAGHHGTVYGASLTSGQYDYPDSAYNFDGSNDYIDIPTHSDLRPTGNLTISMVIRHYGTTSEAFILDHYKGYSIKLINDSGVYKVAGYLNGVKHVETPVIYNQWAHVVLTYDKVNVNLYLDGVLTPKDTAALSDDLDYTSAASQAWGFSAAKTGGSSSGLANDATNYTASITIDGGSAQSISIVGSASQSITSVRTEIDSDLTEAVCAFDDTNDEIVVTSNTTGSSSTVSISDNNLFQSLSDSNASASSAKQGAPCRLRLGADSRSSAGYFSGTIAELDIYDRTLNANEVNVLYTDYYNPNN